MSRPARAFTAAALILGLAAGLPAAALGAKDWIAGSLRVEAGDFTMGQLIALKGAVENGDQIRATGVMMDAGRSPLSLVPVP